MHASIITACYSKIVDSVKFCVQVKLSTNVITPIKTKNSLQVIFRSALLLQMSTDR